MIHRASHSFRIGQVIPYTALRETVCCYWQAFLDVIHSPSSVFNQASAVRDISQIY